MGIRVVVYSIVKPSSSLRKVPLNLPYNIAYEASLMLIYYYCRCRMDAMNYADSAGYAAFSYSFLTIFVMSTSSVLFLVEISLS